MSPESQKKSPDTLAIHADHELNKTESVAPPIYQTTNFKADNAEDFLEMATTPRHDRFYTRCGNPTHSQAEAVIAALEGGETALVSASGMGAISSAILAHVKKGDHVVAQKNHYPGTQNLLSEYLPRWGVEVTLVDGKDSSQFEAACRPNTRLFMLETPTNPLLELVDLEAVSKIAKARKITTVIDNTIASPINQRPLDFGIDIVVHSATKSMAGHSDLIAGAVVGKKAAIETIWKTMIVLGSSMNALDSWLLLRGLRTLPLRMTRQSQNALQLARYLSQHSKVARVHYPGLESHPQNALAKKQMKAFGGLLSFELKGNATETEKLISSLKLAVRASSLGAVETLVVRPAAQWAKMSGDEGLARAGISQGLIRISCGIEDERDLIADFEKALGR